MALKSEKSADVRLGNCRSRLTARSVPDLAVDSLKVGVSFALALTLLQRIVGLGRGVLFCRLLPEDQLGQWSLSSSYLLLLAPLAVLGLPGCFSRFVEHYRQQGQLRSFLLRVSAISALLTLLMMLALLVFSESLSQLLFGNPSESGLVFCLVFSLGLVAFHNFVVSLLEALRQVRLVTVMRFIAGIGFAVLGVGLIFLWSNGAQAVILAFGISCLIGTLPAVYYLSRNWGVIVDSDQPLGHRTMWSRIAPFAGWLWVMNVLANLYELADRSMLVHLAPVSAEEAQGLVGQYHSGLLLPLVLVGLSSMLAGLLMPYLSELWERGRRDEVSAQLRWVLKLFALGGVAAGLIVLALSPVLFEHVLEGRYARGLSVLPLTLTYCIWVGLLTFGQDYLWCKEKGRWACLAVVVGLGLNILLNLALIPAFGLSGAVWSTATSNLVSLAALYWINCRFGWKPDRGVWITAVVPLVLLLPLATSVGVFAIVCWAGVRYRWILTDTEFGELRQTVEAALRYPKLSAWWPLRKRPV